MKKGLVSIIIVNTNSLHNLKGVLPSLKKIKYKNTETIVVDHASTDGSIEYIKKNYPKVKLLEKKKNLGFAKGNNVGLKEASGEYILLLNDDTLVEPDFLNILVDAIKEEGVGVVQPKILFEDSKKLQSAGTFLTSSGFLYHYGYDKNPKSKKYNKSFDIFSANGSCMLIRREVISKVGLFDEDFFLYFEETDFCWRVWLNGYTVRYIPTSKIYHKGGRTTKKLPSAFVNFHSFKNRINAMIKNLGFVNLVWMLPLQIAFNEVASFMFLFRGGFSVAFSVQRAMVWNLVVLRKTLSKRRKVQNKYRKISDKKLFSKIKRKVKASYYLYLFTGLDKYKD